MLGTVGAGPVSNRWLASKGTHDRRDDQQYEEDKEENPRDIRGRASHTREAEYTGDDRDDEEEKRPAKHKQ